MQVASTPNLRQKTNYKQLIHHRVIMQWGISNILHI